MIFSYFLNSIITSEVVANIIILVTKCTKILLASVHWILLGLRILHWIKRLIEIVHAWTVSRLAWT